MLHGQVNDSNSYAVQYSIWTVIGSDLWSEGKATSHELSGQAVQKAVKMGNIFSIRHDGHRPTSKNIDKAKCQKT